MGRRSRSAWTTTTRRGRVSSTAATSMVTDGDAYKRVGHRASFYRKGGTGAGRGLVDLSIPRAGPGSGRAEKSPGFSDRENHAHDRPMGCVGPQFSGWARVGPGLGRATRAFYSVKVRTMCGSRTDGWSLPCVMSD
jgi:hypothetical protein